MIDFLPIFETIWQRYSGEAAWQAVVDLSGYHRIQASPGHRDAAGWLCRCLSLANVDAEILAYPADENTSFWTWSSFQEWACDAASLELVSPALPQAVDRVLADFRACPISLIQRSIPFEGELEVVALDDGTDEKEYEGVDVAGKLVLTRGEVHRAWELAAAHGAAGILFDGMRAVEPVRRDGDLDDVRQYTSFWWGAGEPRAFGFVLTPRQGRALRKMIETSDTPVRVRARVQSRLYDGELEVLSAIIPGEECEEEVIVVAHLCHPRPSANDNASGAAAALEAARTLQLLIDTGQLARPRRAIRFLWLPEMTGSLAYLSRRAEAAPRMVAGLNLDMVGESQEQTGSSWLVERPPDAAASFASTLLAWLRDEMPMLKGMTGISPSYTGLGGYPLYRHAEVPFSGGSDHYVFADPTVGVPMPMLIQWPDRYYHTSADTPDRVDPQSLARTGALAAAYAYWIASAGTDEVMWLGYEMTARFKAQMASAAQEAVTRLMAGQEGNDLRRCLDDADRHLAYRLDRHQAALYTLDRLAPVECLLDDLSGQAYAAAARELGWVRDAAGLWAAHLGLDGVPEAAEVELSELEQQAAALTPVRQIPGPVSLRDLLARLGEEEREAWRKLQKERQGQIHTITSLGVYWADGERTLLDIADLVEMEAGVRDLELLLRFFELLEKVGWAGLA
jgi:aminopeptidase YwaD